MMQCRVSPVQVEIPNLLRDKREGTTNKEVSKNIPTKMSAKKVRLSQTAFGCTRAAVNNVPPFGISD